MLVACRAMPFIWVSLKPKPVEQSTALLAAAGQTGWRRNTELLGQVYSHVLFVYSTTMAVQAEKQEKPDRGLLP
jgi:hypothetical protein